MGAQIVSPSPTSSLSSLPQFSSTISYHHTTTRLATSCSNSGIWHIPQSRQKNRFRQKQFRVAIHERLFVKHKITSSWQGRKFFVRCLLEEEERRKFGSVPPPDYPPSTLPRSLDLDVDEELELPIVRRLTSESRRGPSYEEDYEFGYRRRKKKGPTEENRAPSLSLLTGVNKFIVGGIFVLGMGAGIAVDTTLNVEPSNVASREVIDRQTPNPDICIANGMSAMVLDHRIFITFNPFNVYVSQAEVKPGCVLRQSNWSVLESRGLVSTDEVWDCKRNMNTFGFVGDLRQAPEISCVYHSESAENQFLKDPAKAALGDGFQPKDFDN